MNVRNTLLAGHTKCATRWLAEVVKSNPHIHYETWRGDPNILKISEKPVFFDYCWSITDENVLDQFQSVDEDLQAIVIYREPVDVLVSNHNYSRKAYGRGQFGGPAGSVSYEKFISDRDFVQSVQNGQLKQVLETEFPYDQSAERVRARFPSFREFLYDDIAENPEAFLKALFGFCGVPAEYKLPEKPVNKSLAYRSWTAHQVLMFTLHKLTGLDSRHFTDAFASGAMYGSPAKWLMRLNNKPANFLKPKQREALKEVTRPMVERFQKITDLDLSRWDY